MSEKTSDTVFSNSIHCACHSSPKLWLIFCQMKISPPAWLILYEFEFDSPVSFWFLPSILTCEVVYQLWKLLVGSARGNYDGSISINTLTLQLCLLKTRFWFGPLSTEYCNQNSHGRGKLRMGVHYEYGRHFYIKEEMWEVFVDSTWTAMTDLFWWFLLWIRSWEIRAALVVR